MSLLYENNLMNSFLFKFDRNRWTSPMCICGTGDQDALHLLTSCSLVNSQTRKKLTYLLKVCNQENPDNLSNGVVAILNTSRDPEFTACCLDVVETAGLNLRSKITLASKKNRI